MTLLQPTAALTDLLLALTAFAMAWGALRHSVRTGSRRTRWWSLGYGLLGLGAFLGFLTLGFRTGLEPLFYYVSRLSVGIAVLAMLTAVVESLVSPAAARRWRWLFLLAFVAYYGATLAGGSFLVFILYSGTALVATLTLELYRWLGRREAGAGWMALGMALSILAAVLQAAKLSFTLVWTFDHNGVYHLVQTVALFFLYRGVTARGGAEGDRINQPA
ncbi:MAG: DUF6962 family protein [Bacillota bacterium]